MFDSTLTYRARIWMGIVLFIVLSFSWSERLSSIGIILLSLHFLLDQHLLEKCRKFRLSAPLLLMWTFFGVQLLAMGWTNHWSDVGQSVMVKLSFLVLPFLLSTENYLDTKQTRFLFWCFSTSLLLSFTYSAIMDYVRYIPFGWNAVLNRVNISEAIMHPGYYSNYFALVTTWHLVSLLHDKNLARKTILLHLFFIGFGVLVLLLLIAKTCIIYLAIVGLYVSWQLLLPIKNSGLRIIAYLASWILIAGIALQIPTIKNRIHEAQQDRQHIDKNIGLANSTGSRVIAWQNEWILIKQKPLLGYGTGSANAVLQQQLAENGYQHLASDGMHTHHQIFHTWLDTGILGVLSLLMMMIVFAKNFWQQKHTMGLALLLLFVLNLLTDDMLEVQAGLVFFVMFFCLFLFQPQAARD
ncbi:MAG: hypothetical protein RIQ62_1339 [Bacteroidota bacterium]